MSYAVYKLVHLFGIFMMLAGVSFAAGHAALHGTAGRRQRRMLLFTHGIAAFLILLGGFGMLARLGVMHGALPGWVLAKLAIWGALAVAIALIHRGPRAARSLLVITPLLAMAAAAIALYKPF